MLFWGLEKGKSPLFPDCKKQFLPEAATDYLVLQPPLELGIKCTLTWLLATLVIEELALYTLMDP